MKVSWTPAFCNNSCSEAMWGPTAEWTQCSAWMTKEKNWIYWNYTWVYIQMLMHTLGAPFFFWNCFFELEPSDTLMNPCSNAPKMQKLSVSMLALWFSMPIKWLPRAPPQGENQDIHPCTSSNSRLPLMQRDQTKLGLKYARYNYPQVNIFIWTFQKPTGCKMPRDPYAHKRTNNV